MLFGFSLLCVLCCRLEYGEFSLLCISITAFVAKPESFRDARIPDFLPVPSDNHFYMRLQVCFFKLS